MDTMRGLTGRLATLPRPRLWAGIASAVWSVVVVGYGVGFLAVAGAGQGRGTLFLDAMFFLLTLTMPLVLVWLAAWLAEELETQRALVSALADAAVPLAQALEASRQTVERPAAAAPDAMQRVVKEAMAGLRAPDLGRPLDRLIIGQSRIEAALQRLLAEPRPAAPGRAPAVEATVDAPAIVPVPPAPDPEAAAPAAPEPAAARPVWPDLVRALDFPRDAADEDGFRALRTALRHPSLAQMLQAAEDVLNLLSQEGIYVDELPMDPVDPAAWRRFMRGVRGAEVTSVGGIRDPRALDTARRLSKSDSIFRDSALFFQRRFDGILGEFGGEASDADLIELAGTRSGRVFALLARLNGSLD